MLDAGADYQWVDGGDLLAGMRVAARVGALVAVDAESEAITQHESAEAKHLGDGMGRSWPTDAHRSASWRQSTGRS